MSERLSNRQRWQQKFSVAFAGLGYAVAHQNSFWVHATVSVIVIVLATWLSLDPLSWALLVTMIGLVMTCELINTAIEDLVRVVHPDQDARIGRVLDVAAAAVLVASFAAVIVGLLVLGPPLWASFEESFWGEVK